MLFVSSTSSGHGTETNFVRMTVEMRTERIAYFSFTNMIQSYYIRHKIYVSHVQGEESMKRQLQKLLLLTAMVHTGLHADC